MRFESQLCSLLTSTAIACTLLQTAACSSKKPSEAAAPAKPYVVIVENGSREHPRNSEGGIVELRDGSWLQIWSEWVHNPEVGNDLSPSNLVMAVSHDEGRTWQDKHIVVKNNPGDLNVMPSSIIRLDNGELALEYQRNHSKSSTSAFIEFSRDEGATWSSPVRIWGPTKNSYVLASTSTLRQMSNGRLLSPVTIVPGQVWGKEEHDVVGVYWSDDRGQTWRQSDTRLDLPMRGAMEPNVAERADGTLLMVLRTELGSLFGSTSSDGIHWSLPQTLGVGAPESRASIARLPHSKDLVLAWNHSLYNPKSRDGHFGLRTPLTVAISKDGGKTWINRKNIEGDPDYEYTNIGIAFTSKGMMVLSYMASRMTANGSFGRTAIDLRNAIVPIRWLFEP